MLFCTADVPGKTQYYCNVDTRDQAEIEIAARLALTFGPDMFLLADGTNVPPPTTKFVYYIRRGIPDELLGGNYKECAQWD